MNFLRVSNAEAGEELYKMIKNIAISIGIFGFLFLVQLQPVQAVTVLEGEGRAYPVKEKSQSQKLLERFKKSKKNPVKKTDRYKKWSVRLKSQPSVARHDQTRLVDITFTLPFDIEDEEGNVILPKGYKYNPLENLHRMTSLIIVDGENDDHIEWAKEKSKIIQGKTMILISKGSYLKVRDKYKLRVFHLDDNVMSRFQIERVPCTVVQKGLFLEVHEYAF